ncbi:MAG: HEAT repeat domain-containing protein [Planctomycetes bacterium]|nr:HEAT repeat domain-containing protein [Planctomycetota bacterium]
MKLKLLVISCLLLVVLFVVTSIFPLSADTVVLKNGSTLEGIVVSEDDESIILDADDMKMTIKKKDIESITKSEYVPPSESYKPPQEKPDDLQHSSEVTPVKPITPTDPTISTSSSDPGNITGIALSDDGKTPEQIEINNILKKLVDPNEKEPWKISPELTEKGKSDISYLISLMVSPSNNVNIRRWIIYALGQIMSSSDPESSVGEKTATALKGVLSDPDEIIRSATVEALGHFKPPEKLSHLKEEKDTLGQLKSLMKSIMETDTSVSVRFQAINNIAAWYDFSAVPSLIKALASEDGTIRSAASDALVKFINLPQEEQPKYTKITYDIIPMLIPKLRENQLVIRKEILAILGKVKDKRAFDVLRQLITDQNPEIRMLAVVALGSMVDKETVDILLDMMESDSDKATRIQILQVLQTIKIEASIPRIIEILKDPDKEIRYSASRALRQITGKALGATYELWKDWWDKLQGIK